MHTFNKNHCFIAIFIAMLNVNMTNRRQRRLELQMFLNLECFKKTNVGHAARDSQLFTITTRNLTIGIPILSSKIINKPANITIRLNYIKYLER